MAPIDSFTRYLSFTSANILNRLAYLSTEIAVTHRELAHVMVEKERAKMASYGQPASSVKAMEVQADMASSDANQSVIELRGELAALLEEKSFLLLLLESSSHGADSAAP